VTWPSAEIAENFIEGRALVRRPIVGVVKDDVGGQYVSRSIAPKFQEWLEFQLALPPASADVYRRWTSLARGVEAIEGAKAERLDIDLLLRCYDKIDEEKPDCKGQVSPTLTLQRLKVYDVRIAATVLGYRELGMSFSHSDLVKWPDQVQPLDDIRLLHEKIQRALNRHRGRTFGDDIGL